MNEKIKALIIKHYELIAYLFFGVMTTLVNYAVYYICSRFLGVSLEIANIIAWIISVLFAFSTNKVFVFRSMNFSTAAMIKECVAFFGMRLISGAFDIIAFTILIKLSMNDILAKVIISVAVIILNYIFSKLIWRKKKPQNNILD